MAPPPASPAASSNPKRSSDRSGGSETRDRLIEAARQALRIEGIAGTSARAIARHGELNQALVFYHFGSVDGLLQAVAREDSERRAERYAERLSEASTLAQLVAVGRDIHEDELGDGSTAVLTQLLAGAVSSPTLAAAIHDGMTAWTTLVADTLGRVVGGTPLEGVAPLDDLSFAIASLFLGMELMGAIGDDRDRVDGLFDSLGGATTLLDALLGGRG